MSEEKIKDPPDMYVDPGEPDPPEEKEPAKEEAPREVEPKPSPEGEPVFCKNCQKEIIPVFEHGRWKCPDCKLFVKTKGKKVKRELGAGEEGEKKDFKMTSLRPIALSGRDMAMAEVLVNAGIAKDFSDLTRKALHVLYEGVNLPFKTQEDTQMEINKEEPSPKKTMKQIQENEMMKAYVDNLRGQKGADPTKTMRELQEQKMIEAYINNMSKGNQTDPLQMMMLMRMMDNKEQGKPTDNAFMDKLMQLQMIKSMSQQQQSPEVQALTQQLTDLKYQMQTQQLMQQAQKSGTPLQDQIMALEKIRAERDKDIKEKDVQLQKERDQNLKQAMDTRVKEIEKQIQQSGGGLPTQKLQEFREELKLVKEMANELGEREKGAGAYMAETITNVATTLQPTLSRLIEQKQQQQPMPPEPTQVTEQPQPAPNMPVEKAEMTPSEKEMANQMSDMYIKERKE